MEKLKWKEINAKKIRAFQLDEEPEMFYLIPLRSPEYMIVHEDAYDLTTGNVDFLNKDEIENKYGIDLSEASELKPKAGFLKAELNCERLTPLQWDGILRAMEKYAVHYSEIAPRKI